MTAWEILTDKSVNAGSAWNRLNTMTNSTVVVNNGQPSGISANSLLVFDVVESTFNLNSQIPELIFTTNPTVLELSTTPVEYTFDITVPVNLEV